MLPGRGPRPRLDLECPRCGNEMHIRLSSGEGRCPKCGLVLDESRARSFTQKVRSSVPEPSQRLMDEILDDDDE
jgi:ribosomal protein L37AE/L43A